MLLYVRQDKKQQEIKHATINRQVYLDTCTTTLFRRNIQSIHLESAHKNYYTVEGKELKKQIFTRYMTLKLHT